MALHTIQIVVVDGGKEGSYAANNATRKSKDIEEDGEDFKNSGLYKLLNGKKIIEKKIKGAMTPATYFATTQAIAMGTQVLKSAHNYRVSDIGRKHGDSNYQAMVNRQYEVAGQLMGVVGGALNGAMAGAMAGSIGMAVGAVAGLASSSISLGFQSAEKERAYQHEMFKQNTSQAYNLARANYSVHTGRVR